MAKKFDEQLERLKDRLERLSVAPELMVVLADLLGAHEDEIGAERLVQKELREKSEALLHQNTRLANVNESIGTHRAVEKLLAHPDGRRLIELAYRADAGQAERLLTYLGLPFVGLSMSGDIRQQILEPEQSSLPLDG